MIGEARGREPSVFGIDHVNVTAPEELLEEVVAWYADVLGLARLEQPEGARPGAWFLVGEQQVHVSIDPHNPPKTAHFGVVVDDFEGSVSRLRAAGCHIEQAEAIPGRDRCYTRDPSGNLIEISSPDELPARVNYEEGVSEQPERTR